MHLKRACFVRLSSLQILGYCIISSTAVTDVAVHRRRFLVGMSESEHPKVPAEIESGIQQFDHSKLKHAKTEEKNPLPSSESESCSAYISC